MDGCSYFALRGDGELSNDLKGDGLDDWKNSNYKSATDVADKIHELVDNKTNWIMRKEYN